MADFHSSLRSSFVLSLVSSVLNLFLLEFSCQLYSLRLLNSDVEAQFGQLSCSLGHVLPKGSSFVSDKPLCSKLPHARKQKLVCLLLLGTFRPLDLLTIVERCRGLKARLFDRTCRVWPLRRLFDRNTRWIELLSRERSVTQHLADSKRILCSRSAADGCRGSVRRVFLLYCSKLRAKAADRISHQFNLCVLEVCNAHGGVRSTRSGSYIQLEVSSGVVKFLHG